MNGAVPKRAAVFLDRDGVLNRATVRNGKPYPPSSLAQLELVSGVREAMRQLRECGFVLVVVTNQPDIARGTQNKDEVDQIHDFLTTELQLDAVYVCAHDDADECLCRKPKPGLILQAAEDLNIDLERSFLIGDRWRDIEAANAAGCRAAFIDYGYLERRPESPDFTAGTVKEAAAWIAQQKRVNAAQSSSNAFV
jgi:D-glycero-D-manno-heptose 1,7-bisphosphate phosphatase